MKYITPFILLGIAACSGHHTLGWGRHAAQDWASKLGVPDAPAECLEYTNILGNDVKASCTVMVGDRVVCLWCYQYENGTYCEPLH